MTWRKNRAMRAKTLRLVARVLFLAAVAPRLMLRILGFDDSVGVHAQGGGGRDIGGRVVDEERVGAPQPVALQQHPEDGRVRLGQALLAGDDDSAEALELGHAGAAEGGEQLVVEVRQGVQADPGVEQVVHDGAHAGDRAGERVRWVLSK